MNIARLISWILWGAVIGGALGLLLGVGAPALPGIGPVIAAGTLATALDAIMIGALIGALIGGAAALLMAARQTRR